ncbi:Autophagy-related protein 9A [Merluccius polli]|uniref:Autophagy-related protein 9A n=1 Tax=Merluccius polli TaxID=89951 RepID=A0AA47N0V9_MERPO|nr:Autophagy-related protein 9A [Merluccius polli]
MLLYAPLDSFSTDARTVSSGSSVWEGQMTSMFHKQQSRGDLSRHTWHRQDSDDSSDSMVDEVRTDAKTHLRNFPRSQTFPSAAPSPSAIPSSGQEGATLVGAGGRVVRSARVPMEGGPRTARRPRVSTTRYQRGSEDEVAPHIHRLTETAFSTGLQGGSRCCSSRSGHLSPRTPRLSDTPPDLLLPLHLPAKRPDSELSLNTPETVATMNPLSLLFWTVVCGSLAGTSSQVTVTQPTSKVFYSRILSHSDL